MYCNTGAMPPGMELETPEAPKNEAIHPAIHPDDRYIKEMLKTLGSIENELHTLNQILRNKLR